jgi:hypothetical protein
MPVYCSVWLGWGTGLEIKLGKVRCCLTLCQSYTRGLIACLLEANCVCSMRYVAMHVVTGSACGYVLAAGWAGASAS